MVLTRNLLGDPEVALYLLAIVVDGPPDLADHANAVDDVSDLSFSEL